ncbi:MAG: LytR/AlgR family response regulator transcription factor [Faecalibacterium prausnitzii]
MALPIAIVEDRDPGRPKRLEELLQQQLPETECTWFTGGDDFLRAAAEPGLYAVVFLDICMAGTNGIETARRLRQADPEVLMRICDLPAGICMGCLSGAPFDGLLKPYQEEKFVHLAAELRRALRCKEPELEIRIARQSIQLPLRKVLYAIARNHYVLITTEDGEYRAMCSFAQIEEKLTALENFMSCNRGVIINMDKVLRFGEDCIEILDGTRLPVRQKDKCTLLARFTQYQFRHMRQELH